MIAPFETILKRFEMADEVRHMVKGRFEIVRIADRAIGRAIYEAGWRWSEHVGPLLGESRCTVEHLGIVITGSAAVAYDNGQIIELHAGDVFYIPPVPHDSWVIGNDNYVSLHFLGAEHYAT